MSSPSGRPRPRLIRTIARKELREALRDRRTIFMMVVLPMLLYPVLLLVITQVTALKQEELAASTSRVAVVSEPGDARVVALVDALDGDPNLTVEAVAPSDSAAAIDRIATGDEEDDTAADAFDAVVTLAVDTTVPEAPAVVAEVHFRSIVDRSRLARERLETGLQVWAAGEVERRLRRYDLPPALASPTVTSAVDHADSAQRGGFILAAIVPMLVVMTVLLGAFYPAIDLTAGEKERGTIQTLFTAPVTVFEVVAGKYLAVVGIALVSGLANLVSLGLIFSTVGESMFGGADIAIEISAGVVVVLAATIVMIAVFYAALVLAVAVLARDFKDAQNLMTPVFLVAFMPGVIAQLPGFELTPALAMVPGVNVILLMKQTLIHGPDLQSVFTVAVSTLALTLIALVVAARLFAQETVLVGERGRFDLLARPSEIKARRRPSASEGLAWIGIAFILLFYGGMYLQREHGLAGLGATQWLVLAAPVLGVARYLKLDLRATFALYTPAPKHLLAAALLGISAWVVVFEINLGIDRIMPMPPEMLKQMGEFFGHPDGPLDWAVLVAVAAISPAICEELLFRGFLFSSLRGRVSTVALIAITAFLFGAFHMSLYRLFPTFALGVVMGLLVWRSRSIFTSMLFHGLNNGAAFAAGPLLDEAGLTAPPKWLLAIAIPLCALGLWLLLRGGDDDAPDDDAPADAPGDAHA